MGQKSKETVQVPNKKTKIRGKPSRKQLRKDKRKEKKVRRNEYYNKKSTHFASNEIQSIAEKLCIEGDNKPKKKLLLKNEESTTNPIKGSSLNRNKVLSIEEINKKEKREQKKIQKGMSKQRNEQLLRENEKEDKIIRKLEKQLKLHKRKTRAIPKSFATDGLNYLLEVCDSEFIKNAAAAEQDLNDANDNFDEDFALMTGKEDKRKVDLLESCDEEYEEQDESDFEGLLDEGDESDDKLSDKDVEGESIESELESEIEDYNEIEVENKLKESMSNRNFRRSSSGEFVLINKDKDCNSDGSNPNNDQVSKKSNTKRKLSSHEKGSFQSKKLKVDSKNESNRNDDGSSSDLNSGAEEDEEEEEIGSEDGDKELWEDIYGRKRSKDGAVLKEKPEGKYIPPAIRATMESTSDDKKRKEKLDRLRKQLKGLLNRLAESNMHNIASQIEALFMANSRNDMNGTLTSLIMESLISTVMTPERLLMEHLLLIAVLHANVGSEVGAHFLQSIVRRFDSLIKSDQTVENKALDNTVNVLAQLYNFKVFDAKLLYEILHQLGTNFEEKNVDCILNVLRSVGFSLRKDDPLALKNLIFELQKQAASASKGKVSNSRVKFLLDILLAIKNNNVTKIPNYDVTYSEHLKKIMKGFIRKGNYVTPLNISLEDLMNADERGKWWVVGSAWTGKTEVATKKEQVTKSAEFSQQLLELARKQRMNTDTRRDIFCIIMSAEDYLDAFEKLLRLGLKNQQEREIVHIIVHCCLQEKTFNPFYAVLAQKFCEYDRRFQMTIKCSVWDKLKTLSSHSGPQISNLAKLLTHLFIHKGLPISTLKIVEFSDLDKVTLRLVRQILLGILLYDDVEALQAVFTNVALSDKLKMFRESLRLFIHHFLLRNLKEGAVSEDQKRNLEIRAKAVEKILTVKESRLNW